jgi:hypothetical protein
VAPGCLCSPGDRRHFAGRDEKSELHDGGDTNSRTTQENHGSHYTHIVHTGHKQEMSGMSVCVRPDPYICVSDTAQQVHAWVDGVSDMARGCTRENARGVMCGANVEGE